MKNSLISKKDLIKDKYYWCMQNDYRALELLKYSGHDIFEGSIGHPVRVMFEGYVSTNKARVPKKYLVISRYYWCKYSDEDFLYLMRYDGENKDTFYSPSHDAFLDSKSVTVIFESYDN